MKRSRENLNPDSGQSCTRHASKLRKLSVLSSISAVKEKSITFGYM